jgi:hypothetical protein
MGFYLRFGSWDELIQAIGRSNKLETKAELVVTSLPDDGNLTGRCSACTAVKLKVSANTLQGKEVLRGLFDLHLKRAHKAQNSETE